MTRQTRDEMYMRLALRLARRGLSWTNPNPMVGAVLVKNGRIIGRGHHRKAGSEHAEINAIQNAAGTVRGSTLYVTLEPCAHYGKTPPCTVAIVKAGIRRVVCASLDPNPKVDGRGVKYLRRQGIEVVVGTLEEEARKLNEAFFFFYTKQRPFVTIKFAASLDGKIATRTGDSKWVTSDLARQRARRLREESQAILVGINTILSDDPHLGVRRAGTKDPLRVIADRRLRISFSARVLRDNNVLILTTQKAPKKKMRILRENGISVVVMRRDITAKNILRELRRREIISVLVEGGAEMLGSFVDARLVDKIALFYAPTLIGGREAVPAVAGVGFPTVQSSIRLYGLKVRKVGTGFYTIGYAGSHS